MAVVRKALLVLLGCLAAAATAAAPAKVLAPTPPMCSNSCDTWGLTIGGADYRANASAGLAEEVRLAVVRRSKLSSAQWIEVTLPAHGSAVY